MSTFDLVWADPQVGQGKWVMLMLILWCLVEYTTDILVTNAHKVYLQNARHPEFVVYCTETE